LLVTTIEMETGMHLKVAEMGKKAEPMLRLALKIFKKGDRETKKRVIDIPSKHLECRISLGEAMKRLRKLAEEKRLA